MDASGKLFHGQYSDTGGASHASLLSQLGPGPLQCFSNLNSRTGSEQASSLEIVCQDQTVQRYVRFESLYAPVLHEGAWTLPADLGPHLGTTSSSPT